MLVSLPPRSSLRLPALASVLDRNVSSVGRSDWGCRGRITILLLEYGTARVDVEQLVQSLYIGRGANGWEGQHVLWSWRFLARPVLHSRVDQRVTGGVMAACGTTSRCIAAVRCVSN